MKKLIPTLALLLFVASYAFAQTPPVQQLAQKIAWLEREITDIRRKV